MTQAPVSFDDETLILVDSADRVLGYQSKGACHRGAGTLHRAFSVFIINSQDEVLLQRRSAKKLLWPLFWSNACCSHPRRGETQESAARRRVREELGLEVELAYVFTFEYRAEFEDRGVEHEVCAVFVGHSDDVPRSHPDEISEVRYVKSRELGPAIDREPGLYTPWLRVEWTRLWHEFSASLQRGPA